jgi:hypothetical protein
MHNRAKGETLVGNRAFLFPPIQFQQMVRNCTSDIQIHSVAQLNKKVARQGCCRAVETAVLFRR